MLFHKHTLSDNNVNRQGRQAGDARFSPSLLSSSPCFSLHLGFKRRRGDAATALGVRVIEPPCPLDGVAVEPVSAEPDAITRVDHFRRRRQQDRKGDFVGFHWFDVIGLFSYQTSN